MQMRASLDGAPGTVLVDVANVLNVCGFALYVPFQDDALPALVLEPAPAVYALECGIVPAAAPATGTLGLCDWARSGLRRATLTLAAQPRPHARCTPALATRLFANPPQLLVVCSATAARALAPHYPSVRTAWPVLGACLASRVRACTPRCATCSTVLHWETLGVQ